MGKIRISRPGDMMRSSLFIVMTLASMWPAVVFAGPAEEANSVVDRFSAAYSSNEPETVVSLYTPDAILLGTVSPVMSVGTDAIRKYFSMIKDSGNKNVVQDRRTIVLGDNAVVVTGFYEFVRMQEGKPVQAPSRFTMLITRSGREWRIAHHHSSPLAPPKK